MLDQRTVLKVTALDAADIEPVVALPLAEDSLDNSRRRVLVFGGKEHREH